MSLRLIQLRSADGVRILMHQAAAAGTTTDSMRMFLLGPQGRQAGRRHRHPLQ